MVLFYPSSLIVCVHLVCFELHLYSFWIQNSYVVAFRIRGLLWEDKPESSWNCAADDEFQTLVCLSGVIYEPDMDVTYLRLESCGSNGFGLEDLLRRLNEG